MDMIEFRLSVNMFFQLYPAYTELSSGVYKPIPEVIAKEEGEVWMPRLLIFKSRLTEDELTIFKVNSDCVAIVENALQHLDR